MMTTKTTPSELIGQLPTDFDYTDPMQVYSFTGEIMAGMLNGSIDWERGNEARRAIFKKAQEEQMKEWSL